MTSAGSTIVDQLLLGVDEKAVETERMRTRMTRRIEAEAETDNADEVERLEQSVESLQTVNVKLAMEMISANTTDSIKQLYDKRMQRLYDLRDQLNRDGGTDARHFVTECCAEDVTVVNPLMSQQIKGREEVIKYMDQFFDGFPDAVFEIVSCNTDDKFGNIMRLRVRFRGTHNAAFGGFAACRKELVIHAHMRITFEPLGVLIKTQIWSWNVMNAFLQILGLDSLSKASIRRDNV